MNIFKNKLLDFIVALFRNFFYSFYSTDFYRDILKKYRGFGFKYFLNLAFLGEVISLSIFIIFCSQISQYFKEGIVSNIFTKNIEFITTQIPLIKTNNGTLSFVNDNVQEVVYLHNNENKAIVSIDLAQNSKNHNTPIILNKEYIHFKPFSNGTIGSKFFSYKILDILGSEEIFLDKSSVKSILSKIFFKFQKSFAKNMVLMIPLFFLLLSFNLIVYQIQIVLLVYITTNFLILKTTFKSSFRVSLFAGGCFALFYPSTFFYGTVYMKLLFFIKTIPYCVMFYSFWKIKHSIHRS